MQLLEKKKKKKKKKDKFSTFFHSKKRKNIKTIRVFERKEGSKKINKSTDPGWNMRYNE